MTDSLTHLENLGFNIQTAVWLARASDLAYETDSTSQWQRFGLPRAGSHRLVKDHRVKHAGPIGLHELVSQWPTVNWHDFLRTSRAKTD